MGEFLLHKGLKARVEYKQIKPPKLCSKIRVASIKLELIRAKPQLQDFQGLNVDVKPLEVKIDVNLNFSQMSIYEQQL